MAFVASCKALALWRHFEATVGVKIATRLTPECRRQRVTVSSLWVHGSEIA
jgi:hypothetical protein